MNEFYQLALSANGDFQLLLSKQLARLELLPDVRSSKRRLVNAAILSLRSSNLATLQSLIQDVVMEKAAKGKPAKHRVIQVDVIFADLARYISASAAVELGFREPTRTFMHMGIVSLSRCTDEEFATLIYASDAYEHDQTQNHNIH